MRENIFLDEVNNKNLHINISMNSTEQDERTKQFIEELTKATERFNKTKEMRESEMKGKKEWEFTKAKENFLQEYFKQELSNSNKLQIYIVTDKYENDEMGRYKITQYKNNAEYKYVVFEEDFSENIRIGDIVVKDKGKYIYDAVRTKYVQQTIEAIRKNL